MRLVSNKSGMLQEETGTFVWRQELFRAWWYASHTLDSRGHISLANIKVCLRSMEQHWIPLSTADPLITPDEISFYEELQRRTGKALCMFVWMFVGLLCERRHPAPVGLIITQRHIFTLQFLQK